MHDADINDIMFAIFTMITWLMTLHEANHNDDMTRSLTSTLSERGRSLFRFFLCFITSTYPHIHVHVNVTPRLTLTFYFTQFRTHSLHFLLHLKFVDILRIPSKKSMDLFDEFLLSTGYESNADDFEETSVEPTRSSWTRRRPCPTKSLLRTPTTMTLHSRVCIAKLTEYIAIILLEKILTVILLSSSVSDKTGRPVGDRTGRPVEQRNQETQIRTLLDKQKEQIFAERQARINRHDFQAVRDEKEQRLLQGQLLQQNLEFPEAHQRSCTEMEKLRKFQCSAFDTIAKRKLVEDQNTILEVFDWIQELQKETNCMNDLKDFQGAESNRSGKSHVTSRRVSFKPHQVPEGMLNRIFFFGVSSSREWLPNIWDTHGISGNVFVNTDASFISILSSRIELMECVNRRIAPFIHRGEKWKTRTKSRSEMSVWTVSQRFSDLQWRKLFKEIWDRQTTTADSGSSIRQNPYNSHVCLLENKNQNWDMYLFAISYGSDPMDQKCRDKWFCGYCQIFFINKRYFNVKFWSTRCQDCFSTEQNHP